MTAIDVNGTLGNDLLEGTPGQSEIFRAMAGNDDVLAGDGDDRVFGGAGLDGLEGGDGNDTLSGGADLDLISGDAGNDTINGGDGDDFLFGVDGIDSIFGGNGDDEADGGLDSDFIEGNSGNDTLRGDNGRDRIFGGTGDDFLFGGNGPDDLFGGRGSDSIEGGAGNDTLRGERGFDILSGDAGADRIFGNIGQDTLYGGAGADLLFGGTGRDVVDGGAGNDRITVNADSAGDSVDGGANFDTLRFDTTDQELAETLATEAEIYLAGDTSVPFTFSDGTEVVNVEAVLVFANGARVIAPEPTEVIIDFEEFDPVVLLPVPSEATDLSDLDTQVESQGFLINVGIVGTLDDTEALVPLEVPFDNVAGLNGFPFPLIESGLIEDLLQEPELAALLEDLPLPTVEEVVEAFFALNSVLAALSVEMPGTDDLLNGLLEDLEGLPVGALLAEVQTEVDQVIDTLVTEFDIPLSVIEDVLALGSVFTVEELVGLTGDVLDLLPTALQPLSITRVDAEAFSLQEADLAIDPGFAVAIGYRNGQVVGIEVIQTPSDLGLPLPEELGLAPIGTPDVTVTFDETEFGNVDFVDIIATGPVLIDNIVLDEAYEVIDFEGLLDAEFPIFPEEVFPEEAVVADGFVFAGAVPIPTRPVELADLLAALEVDLDTGFDIGIDTGLVPVIAEEMVGEIDPFGFNTALLGFGDLGELIEPAEEDTPEADVVFEIARTDGADFDLASLLVGAEAGTVEFVALEDGEVVGSETFNVTLQQNPGTLVELDDTIFTGIDELHIVSAGGVVIDDLQVEAIGEPELLIG